MTIVNRVGGAPAIGYGWNMAPPRRRGTTKTRTKATTKAGKAGTKSRPKARSKARIKARSKEETRAEAAAGKTAKTARTGRKRVGARKAARRPREIEEAELELEVGGEEEVSEDDARVRGDSLRRNCWLASLLWSMGNRDDAMQIVDAVAAWLPAMDSAPC